MQQQVAASSLAVTVSEQRRRQQLQQALEQLAVSSGGLAAFAPEQFVAPQPQAVPNANNLSTSSSERQQAPSAMSTGGVSGSFEQRLKDAVNEKRLAREQRRHRMKRQYSKTAQPAIIKDDTASITKHPDTTNANNSSSSASSSILKTLKCVSYPIFAKLLPARTASSPARDNNQQDLKLIHRQDQRNVAPSTRGWTRQTLGTATLPSGSHQYRHHNHQHHHHQQSSARNRKTHASLRLTRLITESFEGTSMLPQPARSIRHPRRGSGSAPGDPTRARSAYVKQCSVGVARQPRALTLSRGSPMHPTQNMSGNYARNICAVRSGSAAADGGLAEIQQHGKDDGNKLARTNCGSPQQKRPTRVRTIEEEEEELEELEFARNVDSGYAWVILAVVFVINASTFGTARAYGLIFDKLARENDRSRTEAAMPFTIMGAVENMAGPLSGCLLALTKSWRVTVLSGSILITLAHLLAALWADSQLGQLLAMGLMCGLGLSFVSISFFQVNNAYFVRYRNTAFGIGMTGAAFGTLIISPLCQYFLDNYEGTRMCYLMLGLIIAPNVPLALLLKPKSQANYVSVRSSPSSSSLSSSCSSSTDDEITTTSRQVRSISGSVDRGGRARGRSKSRDVAQLGIWTSVGRVVANPLFHLIWPTQLLFCWFNFVFGMIIVDFGKDRGMNARDVSHLVPCWAFGQLVGRLFLSSLVDLKFLSYKSFTIICFAAIGLTTFLLNNTRLVVEVTTSSNSQKQDFIEAALVGLQLSQGQRYLIILSLVFILSMFIALLYILLNGLVVNYVETSLQPLSLGISSFTGSFFLLPRANIIGYYRDTTGNYDAMLAMFAYVSLAAALVWLILPPACKYLKDLSERVKKSRELDRKSIEHTRPFSTWQLNQQERRLQQEPRQCRR